MKVKKNMFCKKCGEKLNKEAKFCNGCGTAVVSDVNNKAILDNNITMKSQEFNFLKTYVYITGIILVLLTISFGFVGSYEEGFWDAFIGIALFVNLFLSGFGNIFAPLERLLSSINLSYITTFLTVITFFLKMLIVFILVVFINAAYPRLRIEQAIKYLWKWPTLFAFAGLVIVLIIGR